MPIIHSNAELSDLLSNPAAVEQYSPVVEQSFLLVAAQTSAQPAALQPIHLPNCPVIEVNPADTAGIASSPLADLCVTPEQLGSVLENITTQPMAASVLVQLLRHNANTTATQGLLAESLAYSTLQHSAGFKRWLENRPDKDASPPTSAVDEPVRVERHDAALLVTFNRPHRHNAYNSAMRDALCEALALAHADGEIDTVALRGNGPSFCSGGDLTEFGSARADAGTAHLIRTTRSAASLLQGYTRHRTAQLHGACIGAGIELAAFCDEVQASPDAFFQLPEVSLGLIPGSGGTVSLTHRIGRQRTAYMALSNARIDVHTALSWGLIDKVGEPATAR